MSAPPDYPNDLFEREGAMLRERDHRDADDDAAAGISNTIAQYSLVVGDSFTIGSSGIVDLDFNG